MAPINSTLGQDSSNSAYSIGCNSVESCSDAVLERIGQFGKASEKYISPDALDNDVLQDGLDAAKRLPGQGAGQIFVRGLAKGVDAVTNLVELAQAVHQDRESGDQRYTGTMKAIVKSTLQISVMGVSGGIASMIGVPAIVVAGVAIASGYVVREVL
ncbi:MAG: hypothetical protein K1X79_00530 [Oligoflexia bacterium]|nr:hypothetical protein [Oligoflexia bacterium]